MTTMTVIGCGLIGGSMALSWKKAGIVDWVIAYGLNPERLEKAKDLQVADEVTTNIKEAVRKGDIVVVSVPVLAMPQVFEEVGKYLKEGAVVTDVGSTRTFVIRAALKGLGDKFRSQAGSCQVSNRLLATFLIRKLLYLRLLNIWTRLWSTN